MTGQTATLLWWLTIIKCFTPAID